MLSAKNDRIKRLRRLVNQRQARSQERAFVAEGPVLVAEALSTPGLDVLDVFAEEPIDSRVAAAASAAGIGIQLVAPKGLNGVLDTVSPQPVCAVIATPEATIGELAPSGPVLVLAELRDPGNVGTLLRTAEAAGFAAVVVAGDAVDATNPKVVRGAAGARFRMTVITVAEVGEAFDALRAAGRPIMATVVAADDEAGVVDYTHADLTNAAIVLGNEAHGLPADLARAADQRVTIPLAGPTESLNVAAAGAILCFESLRQRRSS